MALAVKPRPTPDGSIVDRSIEAAAVKVRANDLLTGGAVLAVLALSYLAGMIILDKWLVLPAWVRQIGFAGFLVFAAAVVYFAIVVPLRRRVNPRYIARQVEQTIPDAKNVLINWVDLHDHELPGSVKSAVAAKAVDGLANADVDTATRSKRLAWLGVVAAALVTLLAVLFLVFKWTQFSSLVSRAVNPFASTAIASRTQIDLIEPTGGNATVTDGEQMNVAIVIGGRVPDPNGPEKPRLLVRHNPDATEYDEFPLERGESSREFSLMVPRSVIQSGFWYKVAAGDAVTQEYRVTVRTRPLITGFEAKYEYPEYLKWTADVGTDARLKAPRGTTVTLTLTTNRELKSGTLTTTTPAGSEVVRGEVMGEKRDGLRFQPLKLLESGTYRVKFQSTGNESPFSSVEYPIEVEIDQPPQVTITTPKEEEITLPANGLLAVDATITDDHGIVSAAMRFQLEGRPVVIPIRKYRDGKPFVREKDGSYETNVPDFKDSVKLDTLTDDQGKPLGLKADDVLVYWVEATDNCAEPKANVGESRKQKVRLTAPPPQPTPEQQKQQQQKEQQRKDEEKKAQQQQDQRQRNDTRPPEQAHNPDPQKQPQQGEKTDTGDKKDGDPKPNAPMGGQQDTKQPGDKTEQPMGGTDQKQPSNKPDPKPDPNTPPDQKPQEKPDGSKSGSGGKNDQELQKQADQIQEKIDQQKSEPGDAKNEGSNAKPGEETKPNAEKKPADSQSGTGPNAAQEKGGEKPGEPKAAEGKDSGTLADPDRSKQKSPPKEGAKENEKPVGEQPKQGPKQGAESAGSSKDSKPQDDPAQPGEKNGAAGASKGAKSEKGDKTEQSTGGGSDSPEKSDAKNPDDLSQAKEKGTPERGSTKKEPKPEKGSGAEPQPSDDKKDAGEAKGEKPTAPGAKKEAQPGKKSDGTPMDKKGPPPDAGTEKGAPKPDPADPMKKDEPPSESKGAGGAKPDDTTTKPPTTDPKGGQGQPDSKDPNVKKQPGSGGQDQKLDPKEMEKAIRELDSENPGTRKNAQDKLDQSVGKQNRETVERLNRDLKSGDPKKEENAKKEIDELAKKPSQQKPRELTEQEKKDLGEAAKNLNSKDDTQRQAAEKKLDEMIGPDKRQELQQDLKDLAGNDPQKAQQAREKLEKMAQQAKEQSQNASKGQDNPNENIGGGGSTKEGEPTVADLENQLKTRERQLSDFKKYRGDKKFLKENNLTEAEYEKFVNSYEEMLTRTREELQQQQLNPTAKPLGKPVIRNDGSTDRVIGRTEGGGVQGAGGVSVAPPGFAEAQKRYAEQAAKRAAEKKNGK
jgi:hypothetical protein